MPPRDPSPTSIHAAELFGPAMDAATTWVGLARRGIVIRANRSFREALAAAGTTNTSLGVLLPCWADHVGANTSFTCPCTYLVAQPDQPGAYCRALPPRFPSLIASQDVNAGDGPPNLRLVVLEPRRDGRTAEPAQHVSHAMTRVRAALNEVEHRLLNELHTGVALLRPAGLSAREWEVAQGLAAGKGAPAVATALGISVHTVRNHLKSVFRKLNVSTQAELRRRLLPPGTR